jgi:hypothetical protein
MVHSQLMLLKKLKELRGLIALFYNDYCILRGLIDLFYNDDRILCELIALFYNNDSILRALIALFYNDDHCTLRECPGYNENKNITTP